MTGNENEDEDLLDIDELTALINEDSDVEEPVDHASVDNVTNNVTDNHQVGHASAAPAATEEVPEPEADVMGDDDDLDDLALLMDEDGDFDEGLEAEEEAVDAMAQETEGVLEGQEGNGDKEEEGLEEVRREEDVDSTDADGETAEEADGNQHESQEEMMEELLAMEKRMAELKKRLSSAKSGKANASTASTVAKSAGTNKVKNGSVSSSSPSISASSSKKAAASQSSSKKAAPCPSISSSSPSSSSSSSQPKKPSFSGYMKGLEMGESKKKERRVAPAPNVKSTSVEAALAKKLDQVKAKLNPGAPRQHDVGKKAASISLASPSTSRNSSSTTPRVNGTSSTPTTTPSSTPSSTIPPPPRSSQKDPQMAKELFGDDFDDDDDDFDDPEQRGNLNSYGAQVQNSLKKEREKMNDWKREKEVERSVGRGDVSGTATTTKSQPTLSSQPPPSKNTLAAPASRPASSSSASSSSATSSSSSPSSSSSVETESLTGIRIKNPRVSIFGLQQKLKSKRVLRLSRIKGAIRNGAIEGEWSSLAVVVAKGEPRTSSNGNSFCVWTLSDLDDCDLKVSLFLFGETFKTHWKTSRGSVVGIVNATVMPPRDKKDGGEVALTVDQPQVRLHGGNKVGVV